MRACRNIVKQIDWHDSQVDVAILAHILSWINDLESFHQKEVEMKWMTPPPQLYLPVLQRCSTGNNSLGNL